MKTLIFAVLAVIAITATQSLASIPPVDERRKYAALSQVPGDDEECANGWYEIPLTYYVINMYSGACSKGERLAYYACQRTLLSRSTKVMCVRD